MKVLVYSKRMESMVLIEEPVALDTELLQKEEVDAMMEAVRMQHELTRFNDIYR